jgi:hypothetical protein
MAWADFLHLEAEVTHRLFPGGKKTISFLQMPIILPERPRLELFSIFRNILKNQQTFYAL